ncbi:MAG: chemotaxis protein CheW [Desulfovermiculus sp.]
MRSAVALGPAQIQLACVYVGSMLCGFDIQHVQEIKKHTEVTNVPLSPPYIRGIMNLRGQIVTVIDMSIKLNLPSRENEQRKIVIVNWDGEFIGFLVDRISDVFTIQQDKIKPPPSNIQGAQGRYFQGVYHLKNDLIGLIDIDAVIA